MQTTGKLLELLLNNTHKAIYITQLIKLQRNIFKTIFLLLTSILYAKLYIFIDTLLCRLFEIVLMSSKYLMTITS